MNREWTVEKSVVLAQKLNVDYLSAKLENSRNKIGEERRKKEKIGSAIIWVGKWWRKCSWNRRRKGAVNICRHSREISDKACEKFRTDPSGELLAGNFQIKRKFLMKNSWVIVDLETTRAKWKHKCSEIYSNSSVVYDQGKNKNSAKFRHKNVKFSCSLFFLTHTKSIDFFRCFSRFSLHRSFLAAF